MYFLFTVFTIIFFVICQKIFFVISFVSGFIVAEHTGAGVCSIIGSVSVILLLDQRLM